MRSTFSGKVAQTKMGRQFVLGEIAAAGRHLPHLKLLGMFGVGNNLDERADPVAIRDGALGLHAKPIRFVAAVVAVDDRRGRVVGDHYVEIAVRVVVDVQQAASLPGIGDAGCTETSVNVPFALFCHSVVRSTV